MEYKYDVFISYSRKDYVNEDNNIIPNNAILAIIETFEKNGITYWFDKEGIYTGQEFANIINEAIKASKILLFISSKNSNSKEAEWPKRELFEALIHEKYIIPFKVDNSEYHKLLIPYLGQLDVKNELDELVRSVNKYKGDLAERQRKEEERNHQESIRQEIKGKADEFRIHTSRQDVLRNEIIDLFKELGVTKKNCPVCGKHVSLNTIYCEMCGWTFPDLPPLDNDNTLLNPDLLSILQNNWKLIKQKTDSKEKIEKLENNNKALNKKIEAKSAQIDKLHNTISSLKQKSNKLVKEHQEKATVLNNSIKELQSQIADLKQQKEEIENNLQEKIDSIEQQNTELSAQLKEEREKNKPSSRTIDTQKPPVFQKKKKTFKTKPEIYDLINDKCIPSNFRASVYPSDPINIVNLSRLISILCDEYGLDFNKKDFKYCRKISDLFDVIAEKVGL
jgi:hypothetical protein